MTLVRRAASAALPAAVALAAGGCGGADNTPDSAAKRRFVAEANAICRRGNAALAPYARRIAVLDRRRDVDRLVEEGPDVLRAAVRVSRRSVDQLERLHLPAGDEGRLRGWFDGLRRQTELAAQTADALERRDGDSLRSLDVETRRLNARNVDFARRYGIAECGREPS